MEWERDGYIVLPGFLDATTTAALLREVQVAEPADAGPNPLSHGAMEFRSVLFARSPTLQGFLVAPATVDLVTTLLGPDVWCRWDQAVCKRPGAGWFPWHQDNGYTGLEAVHLQLWVALTPSRPANGGLLVAPGRHHGPLVHHWEGDHVVTPDVEDGVAIVADAGDVIVFSSLLPHATTPNTSSDERWTYVAEFLPLGAQDHSVPAPHLVVARDGRPCRSWVDLEACWLAADQPT